MNTTRKKGYQKEHEPETFLHVKKHERSFLNHTPALQLKRIASSQEIGRGAVTFNSYALLFFRLSGSTSDSIDLTFVTFCTGFRTNGTVATVDKISNAQNTRQGNVEMPAHADAPVEPRRNE